MAISRGAANDIATSWAQLMLHFSKLVAVVLTNETEEEIRILGAMLSETAHSLMGASIFVNRICKSVADPQVWQEALEIDAQSVRVLVDQMTAVQTRPEWVEGGGAKA
jgi:hypothetical protein